MTKQTLSIIKYYIRQIEPGRFFLTERQALLMHNLAHQGLPHQRIAEIVLAIKD